MKNSPQTIFRLHQDLKIYKLKVRLLEKEQAKTNITIENLTKHKRKYMLQNLIFSNILESLMNTQLDTREYQILKMRFGLYDDKNYTLQEVGKKFGITRDRVRQLEERAFKKLDIFKIN